jgi:two-component system sensor histidine kinase ChiS
MLIGKHIWLSVLFLVFLCIYESNTQPHNLSKTLLQVKDGLCDNRANKVFQDSRGLIWFGTQKGLSKYDGYEFTNYLKVRLDSNSISGNDITAITEDNEGNLWIGTFDYGLNKYDRTTNKFRRFFKSDFNENSIIGNSIWDLLFDDHGFLWIATDRGISRYDPGKDHFLNFSAADSSKHNMALEVIYSMTKDKEGNIWFGGTSNRLYKYDYKTQKFISYPVLSGISDAIFSLQIDSVSGIWIGANKGYLLKYDPETGIKKYIKDDKGNPKRLAHQIYSIAPDNQGFLWLGCWGTLARVNHKTLEYEYFDKHKSEVSRLNEVQSDLYSDVMQDRSGVIWLATRKGIMKLTEKISDHFVHSKESNSISSNFITSFAQDSSGIIWIGTDNGLNSFNPETYEFNCYLNNGSGSKILLNAINSLFYDSKHQLWLGIEGRDIARFDINTKKFYNYGIEYKTSNLIFQIFEDNNDQIWTISNERLIARFNQKTEEFQNDSLPTDNYYVTRMIKDKYGYYWFGTFHSRGLWRFNPTDSTWNKYLHNEFDTNSLCDGTIYAIYEDSKGNIWVGTDNGLNKITNSDNGATVKFSRFDEIHPNNAVYEIIEDNRGRLWLQIMHGIALYNDNKKTVKYFNEFLPPGTGDEGRVFISNDDKLYIAGTNGFVIYDTESMGHYIPSIILTKFQVNKSDRFDLLYKNNINFDYDENSIALEFIVTDFTEPRLNQYAYWLEGVDSSWIYSGTRRYINYTNLDPGKYILNLKGSNCYGKWNEDDLRITIIISPPFWETTWYYGAVILFFATLLSITIFINRRSKIRNTFAISFMTILTLLVIFEFINVTIEPYIEGIAGGIPVFKIVLNLLVAGLFFSTRKAVYSQDKSKRFA